ncbi:MAG: serine hydrolase domain-containing protein [Bacteroidota bacterium]|nr:serine hydrolase domain-containing protein [Bacteroidota bacterium]
MSYNHCGICRKCSLIITFLLIFQVTRAQLSFEKSDIWLQGHLHQLGGRAVLIILKNGEIVHQKSDNNLSPGQKMAIKFIAKKEGINPKEALKDYNINTRARIASCSKWLSAALVMTFVDKGKLNLNDTIGKFFPVFTQHQKGNITILDCLSHMTAIDGGNLKQSREIINKSNSMEETINKIAQLPMEGAPGKVFHYSSIGLQIAAAIIQKISGKDFKLLFSERIAKPCNMINTDFGNEKVPLAAGGAFSTPEDYIHFLQMILQDGNFNGKQILSKESVFKMEQDYIKNAKVSYSPEQAGNMGYGLGEWIMEDDKLRAGVVTSPGLFGSFPWVDNKRHYAGFLFVVNLKQRDREKNYTDLKEIIDKEIDRL